MNVRRILLVALAAVAAIGVAQCAPRSGRRAVTVKGSDTMVILGQRWAEAFMAAHPGTVVQVTGGGSGTGIAALINGTTDVCQASRSIKEQEQEQLQAKFGRRAVEIIVARDGLAVYVNQKNSIESLTLEQLRAIYQGRMGNWKDVGGPDAPVILYGRENSSGTYACSRSTCSRAGISRPRCSRSGTAAVVNAVVSDERAWVSAATPMRRVSACVPLRAGAGAAAVLPTVATIDDGSYPLARGLFFYLRGEPEGPAKEFVDFCLGAEGQELVSEVGYFPLAGAAR